MGSPVATIALGVAVCAICYFLAWANWLVVLVIIGAAGIGWGIWSLAYEIDLKSKRSKWVRQKRFAGKDRSRRRREKGDGQIYHFPANNIRHPFAARRRRRSR